MRLKLFEFFMRAKFFKYTRCIDVVILIKLMYNIAV